MKKEQIKKIAKEQLEIAYRKGLINEEQKIVYEKLLEEKGFDYVSLFSVLQKKLKVNKEITKCKDCYWYRMEDSVWGYCWRFPPKVTRIKKRFLRSEKRIQERPEVFREDKSCGEFKEKI